MCIHDEPICVLAGDIGGTYTRLASMQVTKRKVKILAQETYFSKEYAGLYEIVLAFVRTHGLHVDHACFGIAGPVINNVVKTTNLPWVVDASSLTVTFKLQSTTLINDLEANARGIEALSKADFSILQCGLSQTAGNAAVIAAGTGLGEAGLFWDGQTHHPFANEGGHANFSPTNELEIALLINLISRFGHVSWERVLSGPGLVNIHTFLLAHRRSTIPPWLKDEMCVHDPAASITQAAMSERDDICIETLNLFVRLYGSEAGNLALKLMAKHGVYLGGGIAPRILSTLSISSAFMTAFLDKGRLREFLETIPVRVILNHQTALLGAALCASRNAYNPNPL